VHVPIDRLSRGHRRPRKVCDLRHLVVFLRIHKGQSVGEIFLTRREKLRIKQSSYQEIFSNISRILLVNKRSLFNLFVRRISNFYCWIVYRSFIHVFPRPVDARADWSTHCLFLAFWCGCRYGVLLFPVFSFW
jgi:hypothetical protein